MNITQRRDAVAQAKRNHAQLVEDSEVITYNIENGDYDTAREWALDLYTRLSERVGK